MKRFVSGLAAGALIVLGLHAARAGLDVPPSPAAAPDLSSFATKTDLGVVQSTIPQPATAVPPSEMPGGTVGTAGTYRPGDARQNRITRSKTVTLGSDGTATFDWSSQGALAAPAQVVLSPVYTGSGVPKCWVTALSTTATSVKCVIETVAIVQLIGLGVSVGSVSNTAPAGLQVGVIALPPS